MSTEPLTHALFAARLRAAREQLGLTQSEAAALLGVSRDAVFQWETERGNPHGITKEGAVRRLQRALRAKRMLAKSLEPKP